MIIDGLKKTFSSLKDYPEFLKEPFIFSLKIFWAFFFILAIANTSAVYFNVVPTINALANNLADRGAALYPPDLTVTVSKGKLSINQPEPYFIKAEPVFRLSEKSTTPLHENLIAIDGKADTKNFDNYDAFLVLTEDGLIVKDAQGVAQKTNFNQNNDFLINNQIVSDGILKLSQTINSRIFIPAILLITFLTHIIIIPIYKLIYLLIFSLLMTLLAYFMRHPIKYGTSYRLGLHMILVSSAVFIIIKTFNLPYLNIPFFETIFLIIFSVFVINELKQYEFGGDEN